MSKIGLTLEKIINPKSVEEQSLNINKSKGRINGVLRIFDIKDGDYHISYIPALNLSGYGATHNESVEMLKAAMDDFFEKVIESKQAVFMAELSKYGWVKSLFNKQYHNIALVDKEGVLKNFDMPENTPIKEALVQVA